MIEVLDGLLYQWDTGRKVQLNMNGVSEVHFSNFATDNALIVAPYEKDGAIIADIPNILLQKAYTIDVYVMQGEQTVYKHKLPVNARPKPSDYVYTETEVQNYRALESRLAALEAGGGSGGDTSELIADVTLEESADLAIVNEDAAGVEFTLTRYRVFVLFPPTGYDTTAKYMINSNNTSIVAISTSAMAEYERGCYLYTDAAASDDYAEHYYTPVPVTWSDMGGNSGVLGWVKQLQAIYIIPVNAEYPVPKGTRVMIWGART